MISAKQAYELYNQSGAEVEAYLTQQIEPKVKKASEEGCRNVFCHVGAVEAWENLKITPIQRQIMDKLESLGYRVQFSKHGSSYVPRGLSDNDGNGPNYENYGFIIHW